MDFLFRNPHSGSVWLLMSPIGRGRAIAIVTGLASIAIGIGGMHLSLKATMPELLLQQNSPDSPFSYWQSLQPF